MLRTALVLATTLALIGPSAASTPPATASHYWDVWVDGHGGTHQTSCKIHDYKPLSLGAKVEDIYVDKLPGKPADVWIAQFPKGWIGAWHENPKPQWIVPLSGHWFVETTDGHRVEMGPGEASFGGDQGSTLNASGTFRRLWTAAPIAPLPTTTIRILHLTQSMCLSHQGTLSVIIFYTECSFARASRCVTYVR